MTELISALQTPHALITLSVLGLAVILFITGALAPELTGLLSLGLLLACGVLSPQEALACLLYTSPSPRDRSLSRMPSSA